MYLRQWKKVQEMLWGKCVVRNLAMNRSPNANEDPLELGTLKKRITIDKENILLSGIKYRCSLSRQLNHVSGIVGEDHVFGLDNPFSGIDCLARA